MLKLTGLSAGWAATQVQYSKSDPDHRMVCESKIHSWTYNFLGSIGNLKKKKTKKKKKKYLSIRCLLMKNAI